MMFGKLSVLHRPYESSLACNLALSWSVMHAAAAFFVVSAFCCCCWSCCQRSWRVLIILLRASPDACPRHTTVNFSVRRPSSSPHSSTVRKWYFCTLRSSFGRVGQLVCVGLRECVAYAVCLFDLIFFASSFNTPFHKPASCRWVKPSHAFLVISTVV